MVRVITAKMISHNMRDGVEVMEMRLMSFKWPTK